MKLLLDTHTLAWAVGDPQRLGREARSELLTAENELWISPASVWEMSIKHRLGRWPEVAPFMDEALFDQFMTRLGARELDVQTRHARLAGLLDVDHPDPFDRMLAAQALLDNLAIVSKDAAFDRFPIRRIW